MGDSYCNIYYSDDVISDDVISDDVISDDVISDDVISDDVISYQQNLIKMRTESKSLRELDNLKRSY